MGSFPWFIGTMGHSDVSRAVPRSLLALGAWYLRWGLGFAPQGGAPLAALWPGPWSPVDPPGMCRRRRETSQVPGEPLCMRAPLCDPGGLSRPYRETGDSRLPSGFSTPLAPREPYFRGSITRPTCALSTLHGAGHPAAVQDSVRLNKCTETVIDRDDSEIGRFIYSSFYNKIIDIKTRFLAEKFGCRCFH